MGFLKILWYIIKVILKIVVKICEVTLFFPFTALVLLLAFVSLFIYCPNDLEFYIKNKNNDITNSDDSTLVRTRMILSLIRDYFNQVVLERAKNEIITTFNTSHIG